MALAFKLGLQKSTQAILGCLRTSCPSSEAEDIGVVMLSRQTGRGHIMAHSRPYPLETVGGHAHADAAPADQNTKLPFPRQNRLAEFLGENPILHIVPP